MKMLTILALVLTTATAMAGLQVKNASNTSLGVFGVFKCSTGVTCTNDGAGVMKIVSSPVLTAPLSISGDLTQTNGGLIGNGGSLMVQYGYRRALVSATAVSLTAAQCGKIFYNAGAVQPVLPEASTVLGCSYTFVVANASNFDINPADGVDYIQGLTNAAGDAIRNATVGGAVTLTAVGNDLWVATAIYGTWSDIN